MMPDIQVLDEQTIDKIAAGEVVERPSSVVKELVENAIDAGATAVTVEIKDGGISLIRITDNGRGIPKEQVRLAFLRHATSKLRRVEDLLTISSLGFRGEALSSIAAVAQVELITKTREDLMGTKYIIEGSQEKSSEDIGAPDGTTFLVRNLFYNTPARQKFLKSPQTEASYTGSLMERLALSHPSVSFQFIVNNQPKLHTNGNSKIKDMIYHIYGRDIAAGVLEIHTVKELVSVEGFIGKPFISRGNRNYETYFINGRYIKSPLISKSIEDAYKPYLMKHQYPFTVLQLTIDNRLIDVNVHPSKMEIRFQQEEDIYKALSGAIREMLEHQDMVPRADTAGQNKKKTVKPAETRRPEPFEAKRLEALRAAVQKDSPYEKKYSRALPAATGSVQTPVTSLSGPACKKPPANRTLEGNPPSIKQPDTSFQASSGIAPISGGQTRPDIRQDEAAENIQTNPSHKAMADGAEEGYIQASLQETGEPSYLNQAETFEQLTLAETGSGHADFIREARRRNYTLIGQLFDTYWLVQVENELFIIDQHAAHEKVLYEKIMAALSEKEFTSQQLSPPLIITMTMQEEELFHKYEEQFTKVGFEISPFGGKEYAVCAVPANLYGLNQKDLFLDMLDHLSQDTGRSTPELILEKIASMSCKAAVKGQQHLTTSEAAQLLEDLLQLENPYNCPHGRPTIIAMSRTEIEKKFKRIVS